MLMRAFLSGMLCTSLALSPALTPLAVAEPSGVVIHSGGIEALIVDPKDAGLRRALDLVERRLVELPREVPADDFPAPVAQAIWQLIANPMTLRVDPFDAPNDSIPPFAVMLTARGNPERGAESLLQFINTFLPATGMTFSAPDATGISAADTPEGKFFLGSREVDGNKRLVVAMNALADNPDPVGLMGLPEGVTPAFALHADAGKFKKLIDGFIQQAGDDPPENVTRAWLKPYGIGTEHPIIFDAAIGHASDRALIRAVWRNHALNQNGDPKRRNINLDFLKLIPADALALSAGTFDLASMIEAVVATVEADGQDDPFAEINDELGFNFKTELVDTLGTTYAFYRSDATGGGGLLSIVAVAELANPEVFASTHAKIRKLVEEKLAPEAKGYLRIRSWKHGDHELFSFTTPGLPIPVEITWTIRGNALIAGATPAALIAALQIAENPGPGILTNPDIARLIGDKSASLAAVSYIDSPRLAREGYSLVSLGCSALANAVRSPTSPARDPGVVMPSYADFIKGIRPIVTVSTWTDKDLVLEGEMDRSMLVNAAAAVGGLGGPMLFAYASLGIGILLPALSNARASAQQLKSASQVRALVQAAMVFQQDQGKMPTSFKDFLDVGYITPELLIRPSDPAHDGSSDYAMRFDKDWTQEFNARLIVAIERGAIINWDDGVNVGYADGHVEYLTIDEFWKQMSDDINKGAAKAFDIEDEAPEEVDP